MIRVALGRTFSSLRRVPQLRDATPSLASRPNCGGLTGGSDESECTVDFQSPGPFGTGTTITIP